TGFVIASTPCGTTVFNTNQAGIVAQAPATGMSVVKTQNPAAPGTGAPVTYRIVVVNTGTMTITNLVVTDTVSPVVTGATGDQPAAFGAASISNMVTGTLFGWSNNATSLGLGQAFTFTVTGVVGTVCINTAVSNTAYVMGTGACTTTVLSTSPSTGFVLSAPVMDFTVTKQLNGGTTVGAQMSYSIILTNIGGATITNLTVVDTVSSVIVNQVGGTPPGWAAPVVTSVASGTRYVWTGAGLNFYPGTTTTFTISGNYGVVCVATQVSNTAYATGGISCAQTDHFSTTAVGVLLQPVTTGLSVLKIQTPVSPGVGSTVKYGIVVTNTGTATITNLTVVDTISPVVTGAAGDQPATFPAATVTSIASGTRFLWSGTAGTGLGLGQSWTFTVTGVVGPVCLTTAVSNTAFVAGTAVCSATVLTTNVVGFVVDAPVLSVQVQKTINGGAWPGAPVTYSILVTNTGGATITSLVVEDTISPVVVGAVGGSPGGWPAPVVTSIASGTRFEWTSAAGLTFYPGTTTTFTISGRYGVVCANTAVSNTAFVMAASACASTTWTTNVVGAVIPAPVTGLSVLKTQTPAAPVSGGAVTYRIVVGNTGTMTISCLTVTDTISAVITGATGDQPAAFAAAAVSNMTTGTLFGWSACGLTLGLGQAFTFTITGTVGTICVNTAVSNTAYALGSGACSTTALATSPSTGFVLAAGVMDFSVVKTVTPGAWAGTPVTYTIVVTNTGAAAIEKLTIMDTVSPVIVNQVAGTPAGWAAPVVTGVASGTRYVWSATGISLVAGASTTFTISGNYGVVCASTPVSNTAFVIGGLVSCAVETNHPSNVVGAVIPPVQTGLAVRKILTAPSVLPGSAVTYAIVVTNNGTATIANLVVADTISPVVMPPLASDQPATFPAATVTSIASGTRFLWSGSTAAGLGLGQSWTFTITGVVGSVCNQTAVSNTAFVAGSAACSTTSMTTNLVGFVVDAPILSFTATKSIMGGSGTGIGSPVIYQIVVANTGEATISALTVVDTVSPVFVVGTPTQPGAFAAPAVASVASGTRYVWSAVGLTFSPGTNLTFTLPGNYGVVCVPTATSNTAYVIAAECSETRGFSNVVGSVVLPATLSYSIVKSLAPAAPVVGGPVQYQILVTNTGAATITNLVVVDTVSPVVTVGTQNAPAGFTAQAVTQSISGTIYSWINSAAFLPGTSVTFQLDGTVGPICFETAVSNTAYLVAATACTTTRMASNVTGYVLAAPTMSFSVVKTQTGGAGIGAPVQYQIAITNTGAVVIDSLTIVDTISAVVQNV
ncbi:MAG: hypothetical protein AAB152_01830, partial [Candidatus Coatesbacteria bacterium]